MVNPALVVQPIRHSHVLRMSLFLNTTRVRRNKEKGRSFEHQNSVKKMGKGENCLNFEHVRHRSCCFCCVTIMLDMAGFDRTCSLGPLCSTTFKYFYSLSFLCDLLNFETSGLERINWREITRGLKS
jgi:hypothetical protein